MYIEEEPENPNSVSYNIHHNDTIFHFTSIGAIESVIVLTNINFQRQTSVTDTNLRYINDSSILIDCDCINKTEITPKNMYIEEELDKSNSVSYNIPHNDTIFHSITYNVSIEFTHTINEKISIMNNKH